VKCKNIGLMLLLIVLMGAATACNTIEGIGRDIKSAGEAIEDTVDDD